MILSAPGKLFGTVWRQINFPGIPYSVYCRRNRESGNPLQPRMLSPAELPGGQLGPVRHCHPRHLHVLHAWHVAAEKRLRNRKGVQAAYKSLSTMLRDMRKVEKAHLDVLATEYTIDSTDTHLIKGEPENVIPRFVKSKRIDLVVMGTVGRSGIKGFFMGNTAEKILNNINCSVLAIKPSGWKTPVK